MCKISYFLEPCTHTKKKMKYHRLAIVTNTNLNRKIEEVENRIPDVRKLVTNTAFNIKIEEVSYHGKYITTNDFN